MAKRTTFLLVSLLAVGCRRDPAGQFASMSEEFVNTTLSFSPITASQVGLHQAEGRNLDEMLDDLSARALDEQRQFYAKFRTRLDAIRPETLGPEDRADFQILRDQTDLALLDLNELQSTAHNPTIYVEALGSALFNSYSREYAPKPDRVRHVVERLKKVPLFLDQATSNLTASPALWTRVAQEENQGNISLVDQTLRNWVPENQKLAYSDAAHSALDAMQKFQTFLKDSLSTRDSNSWRLGERYPRKFRAVMEAGVEPDNMLQEAERDLVRVRARMLDLARPIHRTIAAAHKDHEELSGAARENKLIGEVLDHIAQRHSTVDSYMEDARKDLEEARQFVSAKHVLTLPRRANLQVIETPEFMRGVYAVGGFNPAPALEPQLGAFYWVTPIPKTWPENRVQSKLREYNYYKLKLLTIHEAMPGHYVQFEIANDVEPRSRRILRAVYGNGPYIEGWAQYATATMIDQGFLDRAPEMQITFLKEQLRVLANAILDVRLHMLNMTDQEALDLMTKQTFQEQEEATAKLQRAMLSSCQLPTYYVGWRGWDRVRADYQAAKGGAFRLPDFHDRALRQGAVPLSVLTGLLQ